MRIDNDLKLDYKDVLIRPKRSTLTYRKDVQLERDFIFRNSKQAYSGVPIMASNMDGVGTLEMAAALNTFNMFTCLVKHYSKQELHQFIVENELNNKKMYDNVAISIGISDEDKKKLHNIASCSDLKFVCIDVANGYTERFIDFVKYVRHTFPSLTIIAGNVVTGDITEELILAGADIIKIGIGPGSVCTTRIKTGVGYPQLSAVIECADAAHGLGGHIIADGGCTSPSDVAKAFAAGADFVMLGGMLAGHDEGGGEVIGDKIKFYGMSSKTANEKHFGGLKDYRASEGREVLVPYRGPVSETVIDILGGIRSACTYVGASKLKHLSKCTTFIRVTQQYNAVFEK